MLNNFYVVYTLVLCIWGWEGTGLNDIWEVRKLLVNRPRKFIKAGTYHYSIAQIMRDNPLEQVMSAGLRVQKAIQ